MSATEDTLNEILSSYLRDHGVDITTHTSGQSPSGKRLPDFELHVGREVYYGEGEWLSTYHFGLLQALDFGDIPGAAGYFLLGYPDSLKKEITERRVNTPDPAELLKGSVFQRCLFGFPARRSDLRSVRVEHLADWIRSTTSGAPALPDPDEFRRLIQYSVNQLASYLPKGGAAPRLFEQVVATIPDRKDEEDAARKGTAYLLLNQVIFYRILASHAELGYAQLDPNSVRSPLDLKTLFDRVMVDDYHAIFRTNVVDLFPQRAFELIRAIARATTGLRPEEFTRELLGSLFHELIPDTVRHPVAAYYTIPSAARLLAKLAQVSGSKKVSDFACGSGTLLVASYEEKARTDSRENNQARHAAYLERELTGIDIMPFAAHLAVVQLALMNPTRWTNRVRVAVEDSLEKGPGDLIRSLERRAVSPQTRLPDFEAGAPPRQQTLKGAVSTDGVGTEFELNRPDIVIMNPPFSKKQYIGKSFRAHLATLFGDYAKYHRNDMGYWGYFLLQADRFLADRGRLALVLPNSLLRHQSLSGLRQLLRDRYRIDYIVGSAHRTAFSEDASWPDILLVATKTTDRSHPCHLAMLKVELSDENTKWFADRIVSGESSTELLIGQRPQSAFLAEDWLPLVPGAVLDQELLDLPRDAPVTSLSSLRGARLIQGIRMEKTSTFVNPVETLVSHRRKAKTRVEWLIESETSSHLTVKNAQTEVEVRIPKSVLTPATRSIAGHLSLQVESPPPDYAVAGRFKGDEVFWTSTKVESMLAERRKHLKSRTGRVVIAGYGNVNLGAEGTRLLAVMGKSRIVPTWSCWSLDLHAPDDAKVVTLWWNSCFHLLYLLHHRTEVEGTTVKWRQGILLSAPVLDPSKLTDAQRNVLVSYFDHHALDTMPPLKEQYENPPEGRTALDSLVAKCLGYDRGEIPARLNDLYVAISGQLGELAAKMKRRVLVRPQHSAAANGQ